MTIDPSLLVEPIAAADLSANSGGADSVLLDAPLVGPELEEGWQWVREDCTAWSFRDSSLALVTKPGGIWGSVFADQPAPSLLLRPTCGANACEVTVTMPPTPGGFGEQAGLFWYCDDNNYAKFVVEWMRDGTANVVLALEKNGEPAVCAKAPLDSDEACEPMRLRLELSADGSKLSGVIVGSYYMRLVGSCLVDSGMLPDQGDEAPRVRFGVSAHGGTADGVTAGRAACFSKFSAIAIRPNRVQWTGGAARAAEERAPALLQGVGAPAPGAGCTISVAPDSTAPDEGSDISMAPAPAALGTTGGWTLSAELTEEQRSQIAMLLEQNGLPPLDEHQPTETGQ